jgi:hypothetical protein
MNFEYGILAILFFSFAFNVWLWTEREFHVEHIKSLREEADDYTNRYYLQCKEINQMKAKIVGKKLPKIKPKKANKK